MSRQPAVDSFQPGDLVVVRFIAGDVLGEIVEIDHWEGDAFGKVRVNESVCAEYSEGIGMNVRLSSDRLEAYDEDDGATLTNFDGEEQQV